MEEKVVIKLDELPARAEKLPLDEISTVFGGGCIATTRKCDSSCDCCSLICYNGYCIKGTNTFSGK